MKFVERGRLNVAVSIFLGVVTFIFEGSNAAGIGHRGPQRGRDIHNRQGQRGASSGRHQQVTTVPQFEIIHMDINNLKPLPPLEPDHVATGKDKLNQAPDGNFQRRNMRARQQRRQQRRRQQRRRQNARRRNRLRNERRRQEAMMNNQQGMFNQNPGNLPRRNLIQNPGMLAPVQQNNVNPGMPQKNNMIDLLKPSFPLNHMIPQPLPVNQNRPINNIAIPNVAPPLMANQPVLPPAMNAFMPQGVPAQPANIGIANPLVQNAMFLQNQGNQMIQPRGPIQGVGMNNIGINRKPIIQNKQFQTPMIQPLPSLNLNMNGQNANQLNQQINSAMQKAVGNGNNNSGPKTHTINLQITRKKIVPDNSPAGPTSPVHPPLLPKHMIHNRPENPKHAMMNAIPLQVPLAVKGPAGVSGVTGQGSPGAVNTLAGKILSTQNVASSAAKTQNGSGSPNPLSQAAQSAGAKPKDFTQGQLAQNQLVPAGAVEVPVTQADKPLASVIKTISGSGNSLAQLTNGAAPGKKISLTINKNDPQITKGIFPASANGSNIPFNVTTTKNKNGKMEIMLMSKYTGNRPIIIEAAAGNILLSHVKTPDGQTQFLIKHEKPTTRASSTSASSASTTDVPTTTVTEEPGEYEAEDYPTTTAQAASTTGNSAAAA